MRRFRPLPLFLLFVSLLWSEGSPVSEYNRARELQEQERYYAAVEAYTGIVLMYPDYVEPYIGLGESFFLLGEYADALDYVEPAVRLRRGDTALKVLKGRILVALGRFAEGRELFGAVLEAEPNNIAARLGMAELDVAQGEVGNALATYVETLALVPGERRALLGLLLLSDELERFDASESYVAAALRYHGDIPRVQVAVSHHYMRIRRYSDALYHAKLAASLDPDYHPARIAAARAQLAQSEYSAAVSSLTEALRIRPGDPMTLYTLGRAYESEGDPEKAIQSYTAVFRIGQDEEMTRIALEQLVRRETESEHPLRRTLAEYHLRRGKEFEARYLLDKALREYRLAVQLRPDIGSYRLDYAKIYKTLGYPAKYMSELEVAVAEGASGTEIADELEIQQSLQESGLARVWDVQQFNLERNEYSLGLYLPPQLSSMVHFGGDRVAAGRLVNLLSASERLNVADGRVEIVNSYADAFRRARTGRQDYFAILSFAETERSISIGLELYLASNGKRLAGFRAYRTGNDRITEALVKIASSVDDSVPLKGTLIRRSFDRGLIDLGRFDGISEESEFRIVRSQAVRLNRDRLGLEYTDEDVVGTLTVTRPDELVAEGTITRDGFFDYVNEGDTVVLPDPPVETGDSADSARLDLYQELLTIQ